MANKWESGEAIISYIVFRKSLSDKVTCELAIWKKQGRELGGNCILGKKNSKYESSKAEERMSGVFKKQKEINVVRIQWKRGKADEDRKVIEHQVMQHLKDR